MDKEGLIYGNRIFGLKRNQRPSGSFRRSKNASFDEIVEFLVWMTEAKKLGRIVEIYEEKAVIQVFEGTENMSLSNTHTPQWTSYGSELSPDILGRTFNGIGKPIDGLCSCHSRNEAEY